ncbi:polysaccharide deacetylase family protein [Dactylosporangium sp. NPDC051541]|uniref:polysaccharide deacetylase family protein n=1 Tax=Dactylosporangium sp. NPDC051541 TaxID=3363977 RepID=UPI00378F2E1E
MTPDRFAEHVDALRDAGWRTVTVTEAVDHLAARGVPPSKLVALTFDDGFADFADRALPVLHARRAAATLYVPTAYVGRAAAWLDAPDAHRPILSWAALADVHATGVEIGSHGHDHVPLDLAGWAAGVEDMVRSRVLLEERLATPVTSVAYPYGYQGQRARRAAVAAGFQSACAVIGLPATNRDHRFALPRLAAQQHLDGARLVRLVERRYAAAERMWRLGKQTVWGIARRARLVGPRPASNAPLEHPVPYRGGAGR